MKLTKRSAESVLALVEHRRSQNALAAFSEWSAMANEAYPSEKRAARAARRWGGVSGLCSGANIAIKWRATRAVTNLHSTGEIHHG